MPYIFLYYMSKFNKKRGELKQAEYVEDLENVNSIMKQNDNEMIKQQKELAKKRERMTKESKVNKEFMAFFDPINEKYKNKGLSRDDAIDETEKELKKMGIVEPKFDDEGNVTNDWNQSHKHKHREPSPEPVKKKHREPSPEPEKKKSTKTKNISIKDIGDHLHAKTKKDKVAPHKKKEILEYISKF